MDKEIFMAGVRLPSNENREWVICKDAVPNEKIRVIASYGNGNANAMWYLPIDDWGRKEMFCDGGNYYTREEIYSWTPFPMPKAYYGDK